MPTSKLSSWVNGPTRCQIKIYLRKERLGDRHRVSSKKLLTNLRDFNKLIPKHYVLVFKGNTFSNRSSWMLHWIRYHGYIEKTVSMFLGMNFCQKKWRKGLTSSMACFLLFTISSMVGEPCLCKQTTGPCTSCDCLIHACNLTASKTQERI